MSSHTDLRKKRSSSGSSASMSSVLTESSADGSPVSSCSSPSDVAGPSSRRVTLNDIHIPAGFEIAKDLNSKEYPAEECIFKAAEVLKSLRGRMPDGSDGQVAACDYCRRRKIRCDRNKPTCGSCVQTGRKCTTEDMLRKRGPPSKKERAVLEAAGIIFRGTRPDRRRRTATTSLGSGVAASKQQEMLKKALKDSASGGDSTQRMRSHSTTPATASASASASAALEHLAQRDGGSKASWMEMLSLASQTSNPFAESPVSSASDLSMNDTVHLDAGACDYLLPLPMPPAEFGTMTPHDDVDDPMPSAHWDSMWSTFKQEEARAPVKHPLPPTTAFVPPQDLFTKSLPSPSSSNAYASLESGALDWTNTQLSLQQYQSFYPLAQTEAQLSAYAAQRAQQPPFSSNMYAPENAAAFHSAMSHFFPTSTTSEPALQQQYSDPASPSTLSTPHSLFSIDTLSTF